MGSPMLIGAVIAGLLIVSLFLEMVSSSPKATRKDPNRVPQREIVAQRLCRNGPPSALSDAPGTAGSCGARAPRCIMLFLCRWRRNSRRIRPAGASREAALFYGLFLRGHSAETLRRDIGVPVKLLNKLMFRHRNERGGPAETTAYHYLYREQVLSIFDELVTREQALDRASVRVH